MKKSIAQTNIYQAKWAVDQALAELKWSLHQKIEFEFQQYLNEVLFKALPPPMLDGVKPDIFQSPRGDGSGSFQSPRGDGSSSLQSRSDGSSRFQSPRGDGSSGLQSRNDGSGSLQSRSDGSSGLQSRSGEAGAAANSRSQQWLIFVRSPELAHQLHFLSPEVERRLQQLLEQRDRRSIPLRIRYRLRQLRCKKITIRAVLRPQLWQEYLPQPRALTAMFDRHKPDAAEAARIIDDFVNAAPAELLATLKKPQYPI